MVEQNLQLDTIFLSLADPTRRDILRRLIGGEIVSISEIAQKYTVTFAAVSKHLKVLEKANLIKKRRQGLVQTVSICPDTLLEVNKYMEQYARLWGDRFDRLDELLFESRAHET
jgi:DNA-binding transcriptional ArsR family regulator